MAAAERLILCGGTGRTSSSPGGPVHLRLRGPAPNVHCAIDEVGSGLGPVPAPFLDLIDLAAYVYAADQAVRRGGLSDREFGVEWRRCFRFRVPVRCLDLWSQAEVLDALTAALSFLSEDQYTFEFTPRDEPEHWTFTPLFSTPLDEVVLFSGGLDSLGGAVREAVVEQRRIALIQHRSSPKAAQWNHSLVAGLRRHAGESFPFLVPIRIHKNEELSRESTQRTRSFLFTALGTSAAVVLGLSRLRIYENGVVAVNLPLAGQVVGARASRTAHPRALTLLGRLFTLLAGRPFQVENPFADRTRMEILRGIESAGCADLIGLTNSCAHPREASNLVPHCGRCSQCIDRRFAVLAAGLEAHDPATRYQRDLLTGERTGDHPRTMVSAYVETAQRIVKMRSHDFFGRYGEAARVIGHLVPLDRKGYPAAASITTLMVGVSSLERSEPDHERSCPPPRTLSASAVLPRTDAPAADGSPTLGPPRPHPPGARHALVPDGRRPRPRPQSHLRPTLA